MNTPHYLPTSDMRVALIELRRPFTPAAIRFRILDDRSSKDEATVAAHIEARLVSQRLNVVVGSNWSDRYYGREGECCELTVLGVARIGVGEAEGFSHPRKALQSDALKRAAVKFEVGACLGTVPHAILKPGSKGWIEKTGRGWHLTSSGVSECRRRYGLWLRKTGTRAFGKAMDHGDIESSQGDWELEAVELAPALAPVPAPLNDEQRREVRKLIDGADINGAEALKVGLACKAADVDSVDELTQASLPAFRLALAEYEARAER